MNNIWTQAALAPQAALAQAPEGQELTSEQDPVSTTAEPGTPAQENTNNKGDIWSMLKSMWPFFAVLIVIYFFMLRGPKRKQQEHQKMVQSLKKNDRVRTIGGILGTVIDVRGDDITLKIDESNNTKIHVIPSAIAAVLTDTANAK